eukprot:5146661-Amphidinium_carterae.1
MVDQMDLATTQDVADRIGAGLRWTLKNKGPFDVALLMAGTNDLGKHHSPGKVAEHVRALHTLCHEEGVPTILLSIPPCGELCYDWYRRRWEDANQSLRDWALGDGADKSRVAAYVDTSKLVPFDDKSGIFEPDTLHLSVAGSKQLGVSIAEKVKMFFAAA